MTVTNETSTSQYSSDALNQRGSQKAMNNPNQSALQRYQQLVVGQPGLWPLIKYELIHNWLGNLPGVLGLVARQKLYRYLLGSMGRGVVIGRGVTLRCPGSIHLGDGVTLAEHVEMDAKGVGSRIELGPGVFVGRGTVLSVRSTTLTLGAQCNVGSNSRIGAAEPVRLGEKVLVAAYVYILGAEHGYSRTDIPVMDQPNVKKGGVTIEDNVWIGTHCFIANGTTIGSDTIVGAMSFVNQSLPANKVCFGQPARVQRERLSEHEA